MGTEYDEAYSPKLITGSNGTNCCEGRTVWNPRYCR
jgi:hypothetical protein